MPLKMRLRLLARGLPKLIAAILVAGVAGIGLGVGVSVVAGDDDGDGTASSATTQAEDKASKPTTSSTAREPAKRSTVRVQIPAAYLQLATKASRVRLNRSRVTVDVRMTNATKAELPAPRPILVARTRLRPDPATRETGDTLLKPIAVGKTAAGRLRFELAGGDTTQVRSTRRARLLIAGRAVPVRLTIGVPPE